MDYFEDALAIRDRLLFSVEAAQDDWPEREHQRLSSTGHCLRQTWYGLTQSAGDSIRERLSANSIKEMEDGDTHEEAIKADLRRAGYVISKDGRGPYDHPYEVALTLNDGSKVTGHIDGEIEGNELAFPHLLEIKSMSYQRFAGLVKDGLQFSHPDYWQQMQGYLEAGGWPMGLFVAKAKDSSAVRMVQKWKKYQPEDPRIVNPKWFIELVPRDEVTIQVVYQRHEALRAAVLSGEPPDREYTLDDWQCNWCSFKQECWYGGS